VNTLSSKVVEHSFHCQMENKHSLKTSHFT